MIPIGAVKKQAKNIRGSLKEVNLGCFCVLGMHYNLVVKVHYRHGSRNC